MQVDNILFEIKRKWNLAGHVMQLMSALSG